MNRVSAFSVDGWIDVDLPRYPLQDRDEIYYMTSGKGVCVDGCPLLTNYTQFICFDEVLEDVVDPDTNEVSHGHGKAYRPYQRGLSFCTLEEEFEESHKDGLCPQRFDIIFVEVAYDYIVQDVHAPVPLTISKTRC